MGCHVAFPALSACTVDGAVLARPSCTEPRPAHTKPSTLPVNCACMESQDTNSGVPEASTVLFKLHCVGTTLVLCHFRLVLVTRCTGKICLHEAKLSFQTVARLQHPDTNSGAS
ncbi:hypothetical protein BJ741DRAFT_627445 [Chytriomyces cf. hyalinus JEL632]|nr:hypothetical protein BJ741DRAFT_627445 [Chytriomyces cf. hyalinus JEL632]